MACVPSGFDRAAAVQRVHDEIAGGEFLEDPVLSADDLADEGRTPEQQLQGLQNAYTGLVTAMYVTGIASLLLIASALLALWWRTGLKRVSVVAISVGGVSALLAWASAFLLARISANLAADSGNDLQATLANVLSHLAADMRTWWLGYGILLVALGVIVLAALHFVRPGRIREQQAAEDPHSQTSDTSPQTKSSNTKDSQP
jgi:hypothetical protein